MSIIGKFVNKKSFTLIEMLIVIIVVGVLSAIGLVSYTTLIKRSADREAKAVLPLIQLAERNYRMEHYPYFYPCPGSTSESDLADINTNLRLSIPTSSQWAFTLDCSVSGSEYATATRSATTWRIYFPAGSDDEAACIAGCS
ncbi:MAG: prepilin-type N-terminal cleavage/methylation domain-containing protein [Candidatus Omnitrophica bacterium]|nr:prepilin-type N-terminal cleavage/methylation domain-containing protein [Candidatus Omnitrophota bacterium]